MAGLRNFGSLLWKYRLFANKPWPKMHQIRISILINIFIRNPRLQRKQLRKHFVYLNASTTQCKLFRNNAKLERWCSWCSLWPTCQNRRFHLEDFAQPKCQKVSNCIFCQAQHFIYVPLSTIGFLLFQTLPVFLCQANLWFWRLMFSI